MIRATITTRLMKVAAFHLFESLVFSLFATSAKDLVFWTPPWGVISKIQATMTLINAPRTSSQSNRSMIQSGKLHRGKMMVAAVRMINAVPS